ncbi:MAG: galactokinase, partial [Clostridiales bacterium]|nr:galactokinase [Clostridiales bacterium]
MQPQTFFAPGRVNIIGEHIDYNGGYVLPCVIGMGTYVEIRGRSDGIGRFASRNFEQIIEVQLSGLAYNEAHGWANYAKGIVYHLQRAGHKFSGFEVMFSGDIPNGAGLSSSASVEIAMAVALTEFFSLGIEMIELVKLAQRSENEFVGVNCGIMDMFAIGMGKKDFATALHCDSLEYEYVPLNLDEYKIVIMDTNKRRKLNESKYNERRAECENASEVLKKFLKIN